MNELEEALIQCIHQLETRLAHLESELQPEPIRHYSQTYPTIADAVRNNEGSKAELAKRFTVSEATIARIRREIKQESELT